MCAIAPLKETSHSVVLSADVVADLECMPALSIMCVKVQSCDDNVESQSCNSYVAWWLKWMLVVMVMMVVSLMLV